MSGETELRAECRRLTEALALAERDRQFLGFEIHDGLVQDLTAAALLLEGAGRQATFVSPEGHENYLGGVRLLHESITQARQLIQNAVSVEFSDLNLPQALARLVEKFRVQQALPVTFTTDEPNVTLPASTKHLLLRIAQEALVNAGKHSGAAEVEVSLSRQDGQLEMVIRDDGVGFDPTRRNPGHFGLEAILARAQALGASLVFDTAPNHGTRIVVRLPNVAR